MSELNRAILNQHAAAEGGSSNYLGDEERWQLTLFKWRYALEALGFSEREIRYLLFLKWRASLPQRKG